ncbi:MAG: hypothetical protein Q8Q85_10795 [Gemmatimonadales bacterium]|nr:hypothetical protein [Gemmatimonadales bacterium]
MAICIITDTGLKCLSSPIHVCSGPSQEWKPLSTDGLSVSKTVKLLDKQHRAIEKAVSDLSYQADQAKVIGDIIKLLDATTTAELAGHFTIVKSG